jgi:hypothetical protein
LLCRRCGAPVNSEPSAPAEAIPDQPPFAPWGTPPTTPPPGDAAGDVVFQPRKPRWPWIVALVAALAIAGAVVFVSTQGGSTKEPQPKNVKVLFGSQPEVDPVNRIFSSMVGRKFDSAMFLSAFDLSHDSCGVAQRATGSDQPTAESGSPPWKASVKSTGSGTALVSLGAAGDSDTLDFAVRETGGHWVIDKVLPPVGSSPPAGFVGSPCDIYAIFLGATKRAADSGTQAELRNGLTAEKTYYTDSQVYSSDVKAMKSIEPSLAWGAKLTVTVGSVSAGGMDIPDSVVCLSEQGTNGTTYALGDVAAGDQAGTYYGTVACPSHPTAAAMAAMGSTPWDESSSGNSASSGDSSAPPSAAAQSDLRNALTAELTQYTDTQMFTADAKTMKAIESSLDWGGKLTVKVSADGQTVCMSESDAAGITYSIADIGAATQLLFGRTSRPTTLTPGAFATWQASW